VQTICEAADKERLARGMQGLAILVAKRLNSKLGGKGKLFAQRYHARILRTPTEAEQRETARFEGGVGLGGSALLGES